MQKFNWPALSFFSNFVLLQGNKVSLRFEFSLLLSPKNRIRGATSLVFLPESPESQFEWKTRAKRKGEKTLKCVRVFVSAKTFEIWFFSPNLRSMRFLSRIGKCIWRRKPALGVSPTSDEAAWPRRQSGNASVFFSNFNSCLYYVHHAGDCNK